MIFRTKLKDTKSAALATARSTTADMRTRRERFVQEYLGDPRRNAAAAYMRAGYQAQGGAARSAAARLLKHPEVRRAIAVVREADAARFDLQRQDVIEALAHMAFADPRRLYHPGGTLKQLSELDPPTAVMLAHYEVEETVLAHSCAQAGDDTLSYDPDTIVVLRRKTKIKLADKRAALESIARIMGYAKEGPADMEDTSLKDLLKELQSRRSTILPVTDPQ